MRFITTILVFISIQLVVGCCTQKSHIKNLEKIVVELDDARMQPCYKMEAKTFVAGLHIREVIERMKHPIKEW